MIDERKRRRRPGRWSRGGAGGVPKLTTAPDTTQRQTPQVPPPLIVVVNRPLERLLAAQQAYKHAATAWYATPGPATGRARLRALAEHADAVGDWLATDPDPRARLRVLARLP